MNRTARLGFALILLYSLLSRLYLPWRYGGSWLDSDTALMTMLSKSVAMTGHIEQSGFPAYTGGYGYQLIATFVSSLTGVSLLDFQLLVRPTLGLMVILASMAVFFRIFPSDPARLIATALVSVNSYVLFETARGSHMALTLTLFLTAIWAYLVFTHPAKRRRAEVMALLVVVIFALVSINIFYAISMLTTLAIAFLAASLRLARLERSLHVRLGTTTILGVAIAAFSILFVYRPPLAFVLNLRRIPEGLTTFLFTFGESSIAVYTAGTVVWANVYLYLFLSMYEIVIIPAIVATWIGFLARAMRRRGSGEPTRIFLLFLTGALGLQLAIALFLDFIGGVGFGDNIALRLLPLFVTTGVPWVVIAASQVLNFMGLRRLKRAAIVATLSFTVLLALGAPLHAFIDPAVSPISWVQFSPEESTCIQWTIRYTPNATTILAPPIYENNPGSRALWLYELYVDPLQYRPMRVVAYTSAPNGAGYFYFVSERDSEIGNHEVVSTPNLTTWSEIYDNGDAQLYYNA